MTIRVNKADVIDINQALEEMQRQYVKMRHGYYNEGFSPAGLRSPQKTPANPESGDMYFDVENKKLRIYGVDRWEDFTPLPDQDDADGQYLASSDGEQVWSTVDEGDSGYFALSMDKADIVAGRGFVIHVPDGWTCTCVAIGADTK